MGFMYLCIPPPVGVGGSFLLGDGVAVTEAEVLEPAAGAPVGEVRLVWRLGGADLARPDVGAELEWVRRRLHWGWAAGGGCSCCWAPMVGLAPDDDGDVEDGEWPDDEDEPAVAAG